MIGGLEKSASRLAIAAAATVVLTGLAMTPARAADLGGDCCADLEERVAELEATTVRKGNRKVSLTLSGQINKALMVWDDGDETNAYVVDNGNSTTRFRFTGNAQIKPGWQALFALEMESTPGVSSSVNQLNDNAGSYGLAIRQSYFGIKSDRLGTLRIGHQSVTADDINLINVALGASFTQPDWHYGRGLFLRSASVPGAGGLTTSTVGRLSQCSLAGLAFDCASRYEAIRYDTPSIYGFVFSAAIAEDDYWDAAVRWEKQWNSIQAAFGVAYSHFSDERGTSGAGGLSNFDRDDTSVAGSGSILHVPSGLFVFGAFRHSEDNDSAVPGVTIGANTGRTNLPDIDSYFVQAGIKKQIFAAGASAIFGQYGQSDDGFAAAFGSSAIPSLDGGGFNCNSFGVAAPFATGTLECASSTLSRYGGGVAQWVDAAAMQLYTVFEYSDPDLDVIDATGTRYGTRLEDFWTLTMGGIIKF